VHHVGSSLHNYIEMHGQQNIEIKEVLDLIHKMNAVTYRLSVNFVGKYICVI